MRAPRLLLLLCCYAAGASAKPAARSTPGESASSLLGELGTPAAERLLRSESASDRQRGLLRLSALGTARAIELVARALEPGGAARGADEHLAAVRALAPHVKQPLAREALSRALSSPVVTAEPGPISEWVQSSAALALARSREPLALAALGRALRKPGRAAELTRDALVAYPPPELTPILQVPGAPTRELCQTLGELGDLRAEEFLRDVVRRAAPEARAAAALALMQLGSPEVLPLAEHWLKSERQPVLLAAAGQILVRRGSPRAGELLSELGRADGTRALALELLLETDGRVPAPATLTPEAAGFQASGLLELFARGGAWAAPRLEAALSQPQTRGLALYALSRTPGPAALNRLVRALSEPELEALALRALALRWARFEEGGDALQRALSTPLPKDDPAKRAARAFAAAVLEPRKLLEGLASDDAVVVSALARLALSGEAARVAVTRLRRETDPVLRAALGMGLSDPAAAELLPTPLLLELLHDAGPAAPLAAAALAARKDPELMPLVRELLGSADPWLRAHTLLGLGRAREPDALGMIENAYRFEPSPDVRHAAVVALSRRPEPVKRRGLTLAAELDASAAVRAAARLALGGETLDESALGRESVWLELSRNPGLPPDLMPAGSVRARGGLSLPVVADPDGVVVLAGVDPAPLSVRLALLPRRVKVAVPAR